MTDYISTIFFFSRNE